MYFIRTEWHDNNPNDWVALWKATYEEDGVIQWRNPHILVDRDMDLMKLSRRIGKNKDITYAKAWGMHIDKDHPISVIK